MNAPEPPELAAHWLATALGDLQGAEGHLRGRGLPARQAAELAQQAAEKALKGAIIFGSVSPPRTHDLEALARMVPPDWRVHALDVGLARLSGAFREARYPRYSEPPIDHDEASRLVSDARLVVEAILEDLVARGVDRPEPR
jgi:HEPN domain-containing protein